MQEKFFELADLAGFEFWIVFFLKNNLKAEKNQPNFYKTGRTTIKKAFSPIEQMHQKITYARKLNSLHKKVIQKY